MRTGLAVTVPAVHELSLRERKRAIDAILEARFSVRAFEDVRRGNAGFWASPGGDVARGIYGQAMREKQRLASATDAALFAEIAAGHGSGERQNYVTALDKLSCAVRRADLR